MNELFEKDFDQKIKRLFRTEGWDKLAESFGWGEIPFTAIIKHGKLDMVRIGIAGLGYKDVKIREE